MLPVLLVASYLAYIEFVPAYSSTVVLDEMGATVTLKFYWVEDEMKDNGRRVTIGTSDGTITTRMCGYDWAHWARTSVYRTGDGKIAVLGLYGCEYHFSLHPLEEFAAINGDSARWTYLGAFDFHAGYSRSLQFFPAALQAECIEMMTQDFKLMPDAVRNTARRPRCH